MNSNSTNKKFIETLLVFSPEVPIPNPTLFTFGSFYLLP